MILVPLSISYIKPNEFGLLYRGIGKTIDNEVYSNGRYIIGLTNKFIIFTKNLIEINLSSNSNVKFLLNYLTSTVHLLCIQAIYNQWK
jgi:hypothetical protein